MTLQIVLASILATSILSGLGALFLGLSKQHTERLIPYLISLSAGTMFGGVFIHLVFKLANKIGYSRETGLFVVAGLAGSLLLERVIHWHCHNQDHHVDAVSYVLLTGDAVHNILDGILIASSYLAGVPAGIAATVAVMAHKIPKEAGDFGILVDSGISRVKAVLFNILVSLFMFVGAGLVLILTSGTSGLDAVLIPLVIGNFVYIAGSDLLPRLKERELGLHVLFFIAGVGIMYAIPYLKAMI